MDAETKDILTKVAEEVAETIKPRERGPRTARRPIHRLDAEDREERRVRNQMAAERRKKRGGRAHGRPRGR